MIDFFPPQNNLLKYIFLHFSYCHRNNDNTFQLTYYYVRKLRIVFLSSPCETVNEKNEKHLINFEVRILK